MNIILSVATKLRSFAKGRQMLRNIWEYSIYDYTLVIRSFDYAYGAAQDDIKYIELRMT